MLYHSRRWRRWRTAYAGRHSIISNKKAYSAFSEATENMANLAGLKEGNNSLQRQWGFVSRVKLTCPSFGEACETGKQSCCLSLSSKHFSETSASSQQCSACLCPRTCSRSWAAPWDGSRSWFTLTCTGPGTLLQPRGRGILAGTGARNGGHWQGGGVEGRREALSAQSAWLQERQLSGDKARVTAITTRSLCSPPRRPLLQASGWNFQDQKRRRRTVQGKERGVGGGGKQCFPDHQSPVPKAFWFPVLTYSAIPASNPLQVVLSATLRGEHRLYDMVGFLLWLHF